MGIGPAEERESVVAGKEESEKNIREKYREIKQTTKKSEKTVGMTDGRPCILR